MQLHIDAGCTRCANTMQTLQEVLRIGKKERDYAPPSAVVRVVESFFADTTTKPVKGVRLLFDSALQPVTIGIRGGGTALTRQFLYETDDLYIDLRLEKMSPISTFLIGQVLERDNPQSTEANFSVQVTDGKNMLSETMTNHFGEFQLEFKSASSLSISIGRNRDSKGIILPLYE